MWLVGAAALDQHIKFSEGNYGATAAVCWRASRREVITGLSMEKGRPRRELGNLVILNILRHIIIVWFFREEEEEEEEKKTGQEWCWMRACVRAHGPTSCVSHYYTAVISGLLSSARLSVGPFARRSVCPSSAQQSAQSRGGNARLSEPAPQLHMVLALPPLARISLSRRTQSLALMWRPIRGSCLPLRPRAPSL